jgi:3-oxoacyl-[acyl-carrier protein] reductase
MTAKVPDKVKGYMVPKIGLGRFGSPENVADLVAFLARDRSSYMTGCEIEIDGKLMM